MRRKIRRKKDPAARDLPAGLDKNSLVPMTPERQKLPDENRDIVARIVTKWRGYIFRSEADTMRLHANNKNCRIKTGGPAEDADELRQHRSAGPAFRLWLQGG